MLVTLITMSPDNMLVKEIIKNNKQNCVLGSIHQVISSAIPYRLSPNFARGLEMWSVPCVVFLGKNRSKYLILLVCKFRSWQFSSSDHIFNVLAQNSVLSNVDFVLGSQRN